MAETRYCGGPQQGSRFIVSFPFSASYNWQAFSQRPHLLSSRAFCIFVHSNGQYHSGIFNQPPGRHEVPTLFPVEESASIVSKQTLPDSQRSTHSQLLQHCVTYLFGVETRRIVSAEGGCPVFLEDLRNCSREPLFQKGNDTLPDVVLGTRGTMIARAGCPGPRMARPPSLCLSPHSALLVHPEACIGEAPQTYSSGPRLAIHALVQPAINSQNWSTSSTASLE